MQVKRFVAADMRRALEMVRLELGADAIILSSSRVPEGVEILTTTGSDAELEQLQQNPAPRYLSAQTKATPTVPVVAKVSADSFSVSAKRGKSGQELVADIENARRKLMATEHAKASAEEFLAPARPTKTHQKPSVAGARNKTAAANAKPSNGKPSNGKVGRSNDFEVQISAKAQSFAAAPARSTLGKPDLSHISAAERYPLVDTHQQLMDTDQQSRSSSSAVPERELRELQAEIADMRWLLEQQFDRMGLGKHSTLPAQAAKSPVLASVGRRLERLGLPANVVTQVLSRSQKTNSLSDAWPDALANLAHQLPVKGSDMVDQGGIFAFVGPTGVGKTTTIGKLAARYVLAHGADKVALITTDTYRIAAHDQLRSLARILRVPVRVVDETNSLESLLRSLRHCSLILIDTAGFRQGDSHLKAQLKSLQAVPQIKTLLVMSCNSQAQMLKASVHAYGAAKLQGCVLTKLDETASMGEALGVVIEHQLPIAYTTDGQDIPKNLAVARAHQLVAKAAALLKSQTAAAVS